MQSLDCGSHASASSTWLMLKRSSPNAKIFMSRLTHQFAEGIGSGSQRGLLHILLAADEHDVADAGTGYLGSHCRNPYPIVEHRRSGARA